MYYQDYSDYRTGDLYVNAAYYPTPLPPQTSTVGGRAGSFSAHPGLRPKVIPAFDLLPGKRQVTRTGSFNRGEWGPITKVEVPKKGEFPKKGEVPKQLVAQLVAETGPSKTDPFGPARAAGAINAARKRVQEAQATENKSILDVYAAERRLERLERRGGLLEPSGQPDPDITSAIARARQDLWGKRQIRQSAEAERVEAERLFPKGIQGPEQKQRVQKQLQREARSIVKQEEREESERILAGLRQEEASSFPDLSQIKRGRLPRGVVATGTPPVVPGFVWRQRPDGKWDAYTQRHYEETGLGVLLR